MGYGYRDMSPEELKGYTMEAAEQMTLNQTGVDALRKMAEQVEPMFFQLRKTAGASTVAANHPLFDKVEEILLELPFQLETLAEAMELDAVEGGLQ